MKLVLKTNLSAVGCGGVAMAAVQGETKGSLAGGAGRGGCEKIPHRLFRLPAGYFESRRQTQQSCGNKRECKYENDN
jgi:hypothetical protein